MKSLAPKPQYSASTSTSDCSTQTPKSGKLPTLGDRFDPKNPADKTGLLRWCETHWPTTFRKALQSSNALFYHDCCSCFSRRGFSKLAGHPPLQSCPVTKIPSFKEVGNSEELYVWLLAKLSDNHKRGQKVYFPAINRVHDSQDDDDMQIVEDESTLLNKRFEQLCNLEEKLNQQAKTLKDDNEKLLKANNVWYLKYQDLLDRQENNLPLMLATPMKKRPKSNLEVLDDLFA